MYPDGDETGGNDDEDAEDHHYASVPAWPVGGSFDVVGHVDVSLESGKDDCGRFPGQGFLQRGLSARTDESIRSKCRRPRKLGMDVTRYGGEFKGSKRSYQSSARVVEHALVTLCQPARMRRRVNDEYMIRLQWYRKSSVSKV